MFETAEKSGSVIGGATRRRGAALDGRYVGYLSTIRHHPMCVMLNIRPARRKTSARPIKRSPRAPRAVVRGRGLRVTVLTLRRRGAALGGRSAGYLSTVRYHPMCAMLNIRPARRNTARVLVPSVC